MLVRIASLLPAATEWVCAFGAADQLVARSHECDLPPGVSSGSVPVVTQPTYTARADSAAIDAAVREPLQEGLSLYDVDLERLRALRPDLILTQAQCAVCAVSLSQLEEELAGWEDGTAGGEAPRLLSLSPATLKEVFDAGLRIGRAIGRLDAAMAFIAEKERGLHALRERLGLKKRPRGRRRSEQVPAGARARPTVVFIEWLEPLMTAGHWTPDLAEQAGGRALLSEGGARSRTVAWRDLRKADPDVLAVLPCGFSLAETMRDLHYLTERSGWAELRAVRAGRVFLFDGNTYFNRPGPGLYRSVALLAAALYPERASGVVKAKPEEMRRLDEAVAVTEGSE